MSSSHREILRAQHFVDVGRGLLVLVATVALLISCGDASGPEVAEDPVDIEAASNVDAAHSPEVSEDEVPENTAGQPFASAAGVDLFEPRASLTPGVGAVYLRLVNTTAEPDRLIAVDTPSAAAAELHESLDEAGVMRMRPRPDGFEIPPGGELSLAPGGKHIMLVEPEVDEGATSIAVTLRFESGASMALRVPRIDGIADSEHAHSDH